MQPSSNLKIKILVVDDDPFVRIFLNELLESGGYETVCASNGMDALNLFMENPADLIISDMNMAVMNGLEFVRKLRETESDVPVIILTVNTEIRVALEAIRSGANDYLLKDDNIHETIFLSIEKTLEKYRLQEENFKLLKELTRKNQELEKLSFLDGLTDIPNRRYFDKVIAEEWLRAARKSKPVSLIMIDIDYFKKYNDTYGHQEGDKCLQKVAKSLESALNRPGDFVARYGGEEFAALLPDTDMEGAVAVADRMRAGIELLNILHSSSDAADHVSLSMGIGTVALADRRISHSVLISLADQSLYEAKSEGRNRIKILRQGQGSTLRCTIESIKDILSPNLEIICEPASTEYPCGG
jgi:diguanylate cyclase (GGDEF)-like protein